MQPRLQLQQQIDDLGLDRDIEGRDQLVGDQAFRLHRKRAGNADALALAAAEFMGIALGRFGGQAHQLQQLVDALADGGALAQIVKGDRLAQRIAHPSCAD